MQLTDQDIAKFQDLYKKRFGKEISFEEAHESYSKLLTLIKEIYKPMTKKGYKKLQDRQKELGRQLKTNS